MYKVIIFISLLYRFYYCVCSFAKQCHAINITVLCDVFVKDIVKFILKTPQWLPKSSFYYISVKRYSCFHVLRTADGGHLDFENLAPPFPRNVPIGPIPNQARPHMKDTQQVICQYVTAVIGIMVFVT